MECDAYLHRFTTDRGLLIFVPSPVGRSQGKDIIETVLKCWTPPDYFFHFQRGGHVAASLVQLSNAVFARLDIKSFFDTVTRSKVYRGLRRVGIAHGAALEIAKCSTVRKPGAKGFSLPFGYVQSPVLAALALDRSALGSALAAINSKIRLAVYVDDILMSAASESDLAGHIAALEAAAQLSGFELHPTKRQLGPSVEAFNLCLTSHDARVTDARLAEWIAAPRSSNGLREAAIVRYVRGINPVQADLLEKAFSL